MSIVRQSLYCIAVACASAGSVLVSADGIADQRSLMKTSSRLLKLGEEIQFTLSAPTGIPVSSLSVYPRYLETAAPGAAFTPGGDLKWIESLPSETMAVTLDENVAVITYRPKRTGSYLAQWTAGSETCYRYFAVIDDGYVVLSFSPFCPLEPNPTLHATGIPLDYRLPAEQFKGGEPLCERLLSYNRLHGDNVIPAFPDAPSLDGKQRLELYAPIMSRVRSLLPDANDCRSAWIEAKHELDPGYVETLLELGVNDHCGLSCANAAPWLGMPEFPYFSSPIDCRKTNQTASGKVVSHQWDFCGGWHFLGPTSWHYKVSEGDWTLAQRTMLTGVAEFENLARMSGHPAFVNPLYEALDVGVGYPNPDFEVGQGEPRNFQGTVDEAFVCSRALREAEIRTLMHEGLAGLKEPLAAWGFDEDDDAVAKDVSPAENHGRLMNGAKKVEGKSGKAVLLDGFDDYVIMDAKVRVDATDFSIGCWVKPAAQQRPWADLLSSHNTGAGGPFRGISLEQESDIPNRFRLVAGDGKGWFTSGGLQLKADAWQHLVATRQGRRVVLYLDGVPVVEDSLASTAAFPGATDRFRIGDWARGSADVEKTNAFRAFIDQYQRFIAFDLPKQHKIAFARSIDVADYYRRHFTNTPRTLFVSKTDDVMYDIWWTYQWDESRYFLVTRERLPWLTRVSKVPRTGFKDPLSYEFILVEDSRWSIRFERECPNPIWRFDYREQNRQAGGSVVTRTETPDVYIPRARWRRLGDTISLTLKLSTESRFRDYAIAVWGLPKEFDPDVPVTTDAKECIVVRNTNGEHHLVLFFDLEPDVRIEVKAGVRAQAD